MRSIVYRVVSFTAAIFFLIQSPAAQDFFLEEFFSDSFFYEIFQNGNRDVFLESYYDYGIMHLESTGAFSLPDRPSLSINGSSWLWNRFAYAGFDITDDFFAGTPLHSISLFQNSLEIDRAEHRLILLPSVSDGFTTRLSWYRSYLGGRVPNADDIIESLAGHASDYNRGWEVPAARQGIRNGFRALQSGRTDLKGRSFDFKLRFDALRRSFLDFDEHSYSGQFDEDCLSGDLQAIVSGSEEDDWQSYLLYSFQLRDRYLAEYNLHASETADLFRNSLSVFRRKNRTLRGTTVFGGSMSAASIRQRERDFSRNFIDLDGEGLEPWYPSATVLQAAVSCDINHHLAPLVFESLVLDVQGRSSLVLHAPAYDTSQNAVYFADESTNFSLYVTEWRDQPFLYSLTGLRSSLGVTKAIGDNVLDLSAQGGLSLDSLILRRNSLVNPNFLYRLSAHLFPSRVFSIGIILGREPLRHNGDTALFLSPSYHSGSTYYWDDADGDNIYQESERGSLMTTTGGDSHYLDGYVKQPRIHYLEVPMKLRFGDHWGFMINTVYKSFRRLHQVHFRGDPQDYGFYRTNAAGQDIYYLGGSKAEYVLENFDESSMSSDNWFFKNPFYTGATLKLTGRGTGWLFTLSFTAHMMMGYGSLGNGPLHNTLGVYSESTADPNTYILNSGRTDQDRAYVGKLLGHFRLFRNFWTTISIKYRDGRPFAPLDYGTADSGGDMHASYWRDKTPGQDPFTGNKGPRLTANWNIDLRFSLNLQIKSNPFQLKLEFNNIFDLGLEIGEIVVYDYHQNGRHPLEVQIPRGIAVSAEYSY